jgi:hypothetical protein
MKPGKKNDARHYEKQSTLKVSFFRADTDFIF